jgi:hypothetical protein
MRNKLALFGLLGLAVAAKPAAAITGSQHPLCGGGALRLRPGESA